MNYGHTLETGLLVDLAEAAPADVVELAVRAERLGYDLLALTSRPGAPDPWTALAWVAARTSRIRLAAAPLDLTDQLPAVVARAASSLDALSRRRLVLGVNGAGETALSALRSGVPGSAPLWVAAGDAQEITLAAAHADGWLAPRGVEPRALHEAASVLDRAAVGAGREPAEIRRIVPVAPPDDLGEWVADLLPLVVEEGVGTLLLDASQPQLVERFASAVVPVLRHAAQHAIPSGLKLARPRSAEVRASRRAGIAYDEVPVTLAGAAVEPGDRGYDSVRSNYLRGGSPGLVLRPRDTEEVVEAVAYARAHPQLPLGVRSAGHGISGRSTNDGGLVIDVSALDHIEVLDEGSRRVRVGPGATWARVARALAPYGWALTSGDYGGVGVGGLATAGGVGFLARKHGLTIDHLRAVEIVLADGSVVRADETDHADLFWAVRGAGANFGIVTSFEFEVDEVGDVGFAQLTIGVDDPADFLVCWGAAVESAPRDLTGELILGPARAGQPYAATTLTMVDSADPDTVVAQLQPLAETGPLLDQRVFLTSYDNVLSNASPAEHSAQGEPAARAALVDHITPELASDLASLLRSGVVYFFQIRAVGGAVADVHPDATAYAGRSANFVISAMGVDQARLDRLWDRLAGHFTGLYLSFDTDQRPDRLEQAFPPGHLERLRAVKRRYDPSNLFRDNFNIAPSARST